MSMSNFPADRGVVAMTNSAVPTVRIEWHPQVRKVYLVRLAVARVGERLQGVPIAEEVDTLAHAQNVGRVWFGAYQDAVQELRPRVA